MHFAHVIQSRLSGLRSANRLGRFWDLTRAFEHNYIRDNWKRALESGVPINDNFEHLTATIAEATPLYELCASVLKSFLLGPLPGS